MPITIFIMRLHLPPSLHSALLAVCAVNMITPVATAIEDEQDVLDSLNTESTILTPCSALGIERTVAAKITDLYWGAGQTNGSVTLGGDGGFWSTQSGKSGTETWEDGKNVYLEATSGTITVTSCELPSTLRPDLLTTTSFRMIAR